MEMIDNPLWAWKEPFLEAVLAYPSISKDEKKLDVKSSIAKYWTDMLAKLEARGAITSNPINSGLDWRPVATEPAVRLHEIVNKAKELYPRFCNQSTAFVALQFGLDYSSLCVPANFQSLYFERHAWSSITPEAAQSKADTGNLVIAALPECTCKHSDQIRSRFECKCHGHTAIVMPQIENHKADRRRGLFCPVLGGGSSDDDVRKYHGFTANYIFRHQPDPIHGFIYSKILYVRYFSAPDS